MVDLYEMSNFLPKKTSKENITPHKVAVVLFVKEFCSIKAKGNPTFLDVFVMPPISVF